MRISRAQVLLLVAEEMSQGKKIVLTAGAGAAALGAAYLAHKHGYIPNFHGTPAHHGIGWKSKAAIALGTAAALGGAGYVAHKSGAAGDTAANIVGKTAKAAEKYGLTNIVPSGRLFKHPGRANAGELEGYGKVVSGAAREFYRAHLGG